MTERAAPSSGPRLRPLDVRLFGQGSQAFYYLRDPLGLSPQDTFLPAWLGPLLALMDGTRDLPQLQAAFQLLTGRYLPLSQLESLVRELDERLLLEGPRLAEARRRALEEYRTAPHRPPALAAKVYPADPQELVRALDDYCARAGPPPPLPEGAQVTGVISPHIDYGRGWRTYALVWQAAASACRQADVAVVFGTDHSGSLGRLTLTRQSYATPLGVLPTDGEAVDALAAALGEDEAFAEELHHRGEHSIELPLVWLHYLRGGAPVPVVPVLCGGLLRADEGARARIGEALTALRRSLQGRRVLVIAGADLAHVGPAFGDPAPYDLTARIRLRGADARLLSAIEAADADAFLSEVAAEGDRFRICGLSPIYLALKLLAGGRGLSMGYDQCPADPEGGSLVSVVGAVVWR
ncbi:MAG TPA: AmmeMemoRadiSam system protein B [Dehalococcoidia bacterium]|nr:AmmeMemoRadiSam system protein B [Dehalococcoidia bacterium]